MTTHTHMKEDIISTVCALVGIASSFCACNSESKTVAIYGTVITAIALVISIINSKRA